MSSQVRSANKRLLDAQTAVSTVGSLQLNGRGREVTFYIYGTGTVTTGVIQCEQAHDASYTGTWAAIGAAQTILSGAVLAVSSTGVKGAVRARISTGVTGAGGSVTVDVVVN